MYVLQNNIIVDVLTCRDEKDRAVSAWHFIKRIKRVGSDVPFSEVYKSICDGTCACGPVWDHILGYWNASNVEPSRVLFLTYEHILQDPLGTVRRLAKFLGQPISEAEEETGVVANIVELCSLQSMKNQKVNKEGSQGIDVKFPNDAYFRKAVAGDWLNHMTLDMGQRLDSILNEKFDGSGLTI
uniref:Sulfotransferase n=1 Tax=Oryza punctata TaxID=4537 RepID=A0A0E0LTJ7_ORYPU